MMTFNDLDSVTSFINDSRCMYINIRGYPCHSSVNENTVTLAPSAIDTVTNYVVKYRTTYGSIGYVSLENNLPVIAPDNIDGVNEFTSVFTNGTPNVS